jgi:transcriptional regulator with XRE-family HTH domain
VSINHAVTRSSRVRNRGYCTGEGEGLIRRQLNADGGPLIPAAETPAQLELEADLLLAFDDLLRRMRRRQGDSHLGSVLDGVLLGRRLCIDVRADAACLILSHCLPRVVAGYVIGIPGLRPIADGNRLDLRSVDPCGLTSAVVRLRKVDRRSLPAPDTPWSCHRGVLHDAELASIGCRRPRPVELMSAVLRRLMLWRAATRLTIEIVADSALRIRWLLGPPAHAVADVFNESCCAPAGITAVPGQRGVNIQSLLVASSANRLSVLDEPDAAWLAISRSFDQISAAGIGLASVWEQQEMRDALSNRDVSQIYRLLRRRSVSQRQIAALTGQSQSEVSEILKGRQVMARDVLARIADGLGIPWSYMGLAYEEVDPMRVEDEAVQRRRLLAHAAAVTGAATGFPWQLAVVNQVDAADLVRRATRYLAPNGPAE